MCSIELTIELVPAQDFQISSFEKNSNSWIYRQTAVKVVDSLLQHMGPAYLLD